MEWQDQGIVVKVHAHGEGKAIVTLFTQQHGKHLGFVRSTRKLAPVLQLGTVVECSWRSRLEDQLGFWELETQQTLHPRILQEPLLLAGMLSLCSWINLALAERHEYVNLFENTRDCLNKLAKNAFIGDYVRYELELLKDLGFGLDLAKCGATGETDNLSHVSPKTGRAIGGQAAAPYKDKLLSLPAFLVRDCQDVSIKDIMTGLNLTGYFLERCVLAQHNKAMPSARIRLMTLLKKADR